MDSNNPNNQAPAPQPAAPNTPAQPQPAAPFMPASSASVPPVAEGNEHNSSSGKMILMFVIGLVIIVTLVGGIYFYMSSQQADSPEETAAVQTPVPAQKEDLEGDLNSINIDISTTSADFAPVDRDLDSL